MELSYYAIFKEGPDGVHVSFPDIPELSYIFSCGEAKKFAEDALMMALDNVPLEEIPSPSEPSVIRLEQDARLVLISCELDTIERNGKKRLWRFPTEDDPIKIV